MVIYGINPTIEALRSGRVKELLVSKQRRQGLTEVVRLADKKNVSVKRVEPEKLERLSVGGNHQGVVAIMELPVKATVAELTKVSENPLIVVLDGIEDPHNLGAIARSAEVAGASGLVVQTRRSASLDGAAVKASAGALAYLPVVSVVNVARSLDELKALGVWTVGLVAEAEQSIYDVDMNVPVALVVGAEDRGVRRLVRERCDWLVSLPRQGRIDSLNASVAAGVALYEVVRQRHSDN